MSETRYADLEEFATQTVTERQQLVPATITHAAPPSLIHGAMAVNVSRDETKVLARIRTLAQAAGDAWFYRIPFKDKKTGRTTFVEGPSIKLANDVARIYGNCDVDEWVSGEGLDYWEFTARFIDLESGYSLTRVFRQRKDAAKVGKDEGRNHEIGFSIGASKSVRNVIINALQTYSDFAYEEARGALVTQIGKDVERWRGEVSRRIGELVEIQRVEAVVGRTVKDWLAPDIATVAAMGKAIKDGMATVDESFPPLQKGQVKTDTQLDDIASEDQSSQTRQDEPATSSPGDTAAADKERRTSVSAAAAPNKAHAEAAAKMLTLAGDAKLKVEDRLDALEDIAPLWEDKLSPEFFAKLVKTCVAVAKGYMTQAEGFQALEGQ